jgi:diguanylate cyclase (GGDEF)-like protein
VLAFVVGLIATFALTIQLHDHSVTANQEMFANRATAAERVAEQQVERYDVSLHSLGAFYANAGALDPAAAKGYIHSSELFQVLPTLTSLMYLERVPETDTDQFLARMRSYDPGFTIIDVGSRTSGDRWVLTSYIAGVVDYKIPLGIDASSLPGFGELMQRLGSSGRSTASSWNSSPELAELNRKVTGNGGQPDLTNLDFLLSLPAYVDGRGGPGQPPAGYVIAMVRGLAETVVANAAASDQFGDLGLRLKVDLDDAGVSNLGGNEQVAELRGSAGSPLNAALTAQHQFAMDDIHWTLDVWSSRDAGDESPSPWLVAAAGVASSLLLASVFFLRARARDRARALQRQRAGHARFQEEIVQSVADAMVVIDQDGSVIVGNRAWHELVDPSPDRPLDPDALTYLDALASRTIGSMDALDTLLHRALAGETDDAEVLDVPVFVDGIQRWFAIKASHVHYERSGAVVVHSDVTERHRAEAALAERARRDPLTDLGNRDAFAAAFAAAASDEQPFAVLFIDLDGFKAVNDQYGHRTGDQVLRTTAQRIRASARKHDVVARLGGDEFAILVSPASHTDAEVVTERLLGLIGEPVLLDDAVLTVGASIGIALVDPALDETMDGALARADTAMYEAKRDPSGHTAWAPNAHA